MVTNNKGERELTRLVSLAGPVDFASELDYVYCVWWSISVRGYVPADDTKKVYQFTGTPSVECCSMRIFSQGWLRV
jgi:hypothetical protein